MKTLFWRCGGSCLGGCLGVGIGGRLAGGVAGRFGSCSAGSVAGRPACRFGYRLAVRLTGRLAVALLASAVFLSLMAGCSSDPDSPPEQTSLAPLPTAPTDNADTPPVPPPIGDLLPETDLVFPTAEPVPTIEPPPTAEPVPTAEPPPTAEPVPTVEPVPTIEPPPTLSESQATAGIVERLTPEVVAVYPHDTNAFTQGLLLDGGRMYESTGLFANSTIREVDYRSGEVLRQVVLANTDAGNGQQYFAEGLALVDDGQGDSRLIQLTWLGEVAFVWDTETFHETAEPTDIFRYEGAGWGLCYDGDRLAMSNGSSEIYFRDPDTFAQIGNPITATRNGEPVDFLNELECVGDDIWANIWLWHEIVRIDSRTGEITAVLDASSLVAAMQEGCAEVPEGTAASGVADSELTAAAVAAIQDAGLVVPCVTDPDSVLNGIAYDSTTGRYLLTGKNWPLIFEVRF